MGNMLSHAVRGHSRTLMKAAGVTIALRRGGNCYAEIQGIPTNKEYLTFDTEGLPFKKKICDWLISLEELRESCQTLGTGIDRIVAGDEIFVAVHPLNHDFTHLENCKYETCPIDKRPVVEPEDAFGYMAVIHSEEKARHA